MGDQIENELIGSKVKIKTFFYIFLINFDL